MAEARGIRNHNPGNIKVSEPPTPWEGLQERSRMTEEQKAETVFCVFRAPWWGIRALTKVMLTYARHHRIGTVAGIVYRYAEEYEGEPLKHYVDYLCKRLGVQPNEQINVFDFNTMYPLVKAICHIECGLTDETDPYQWEYQTGIIMAGVEP